jgi:hypothetical protein
VSGALSAISSPEMLCRQSEVADVKWSDADRHVEEAANDL